MKSVEQMVRNMRAELADEYYQRLYDALIAQDKNWLVEELIKQLAKHDDGPSLGKQIIQNLGQDSFAAEEGARINRIKRMRLDEWRLSGLIEKYNQIQVTRSEDCFYLIDPPAKGTDIILPRHRTEEGQALLQEAKDILYALLYGTKEERVDLKRVEHELLTIVLPRPKSYCMGFLRTVTEISSLGNWRDPEGHCSDEQSINSILEIQYGEVASEKIGDGIISTLRLINELEINEKVLYARMRNVEQSSLEISE